ncbi:hypothetical protein ACFSC4_14810 [Deinococcus malanensis]|uniref:hypothetical protein n=1 Tax=Deinococcus malanensis TaxID=1706855 RepID=UPI003636051D
MDRETCMKTLPALAALTFLSSALATPLSLKQVVVQGGGYIQATGPDSFLITHLNSVPFEYSLTTRGVALTPIRDIRLQARRTTFTDLELSQVAKVLGTVARQCLGSTPGDVQALSLWLKDNTAVSGPRMQVIGTLKAEFSRQLNMNTFENLLTISLSRMQEGGPSPCTHEFKPGPRLI